jgi:exodeoxyribonuclease VII small subunit
LICAVKNEQELDRSITSFCRDFIAIAPRKTRPIKHTISREVALFIQPGWCFIAGYMSSTPKKTEPQLNFEGAMDRLEEIVEQMESGKMMLEELIVRYEEGMKLVKICQERLASAEQRIEIITRNNAGKPVVKNFEPAAEKEAAPRPEEKGANKNDDVSLF